MQRQFKQFYQFIEHVIHFLEITLSLILIIGVIASGAMMIVSLYGILSFHSSHNFQLFLDQGLLYLIGLEVAMMLIKRDPHLVMDILTFAIARKMIMNMTRGVDFLFGALAILVLYLVKSYGISSSLSPQRIWTSWRGRQQATNQSSPPAEPMGSSPVPEKDI